MRLGVDPRKANQMVRGVVSLPHGTGKVVRVLVLCTPDAEAVSYTHLPIIDSLAHILYIIRCNIHSSKILTFSEFFRRMVTLYLYRQFVFGGL